MDSVYIPLILRKVNHKFKKEGLTPTDIAILTTLSILCKKNEYCKPRDLKEILPTMSHDYLYDSISKLKNLGYIELIRKHQKYSLGQFRPGRPALYSCTEKGKVLINDFGLEVDQLYEQVQHGYY